MDFRFREFVFVVAEMVFVFGPRQDGPRYAASAKRPSTR